MLSWFSWTWLSWSAWTMLSWPPRTMLSTMFNHEQCCQQCPAMITMLSQHCSAIIAVTTYVLISWNRRVNNSAWTCLFYQYKFSLFSTAMNNHRSTILLKQKRIYLLIIFRFHQGKWRDLTSPLDSNIPCQGKQKRGIQNDIRDIPNPRPRTVPLFI